MRAPHTPGPWKVNPFGVIHAHKTLICLPGSESEAAAGLCAYPGSEEAQANQRLIAAAPDLLAAARAVLALELPNLPRMAAEMLGDAVQLAEEAAR